MELDLIRINELDPLTGPTDAVVIPVEINGETRKLSIADLKAFLFSDTALTGLPTAPSPNVGSSTQQIATANFVAASLAGIGLGPATATTPGTVRTNTTDAAPIVYLRSEIDTFNSSVRPISAGGTGAANAAGARTNIGAAASGANNDITSLQALTTIPSVINDIYTLGGNMPVGAIIMWPSATINTTILPKWLLCDGSTLLISAYPDLYARLGTTYGGNGTTNFNLPNFRGRSPLGAGVSAVSGTNRSVGATGGSDTHTLSVNEMPIHNHAPLSGVSPSYATFVSTGGGVGFTTGTSMLANGTTGNAGGGLAHNNLSPFLCVNMLIKALP